jgi:hypothetical protein
MTSWGWTHATVVVHQEAAVGPPPRGWACTKTTVWMHPQLLGTSAHERATPSHHALGASIRPRDAVPRCTWCVHTIPGRRPAMHLVHPYDLGTPSHDALGAPIRPWDAVPRGTWCTHMTSGRRRTMPFVNQHCCGTLAHTLRGNLVAIVVSISCAAAYLTTSRGGTRFACPAPSRPARLENRRVHSVRIVRNAPLFRHG